MPHSFGSPVFCFCSAGEVLQKGHSESAEEMDKHGGDMVSSYEDAKQAEGS
jgi:hypothetical protein